MTSIRFYGNWEMGKIICTCGGGGGVPGELNKKGNAGDKTCYF